MDQRLETLKATLRTLSAPARAQADYLDGLCGPTAADYGNDELGLELDDAFSSHEEMLKAGLLTDRQATAIRLLNGLLASGSSNAESEFWKREALSTDPRWEQVRSAARAALEAFE